MSRLLRLPIFPLSGAILFPRSQLPLHIFEPRYRDMVRDSIDGAGQIGMIQPQRLDDDNQAPLYAVGCVGEIVGVEELEETFARGAVVPFAVAADDLQEGIGGAIAVSARDSCRSKLEPRLVIVGIGRQPLFKRGRIHRGR